MSEQEEQKQEQEEIFESVLNAFEERPRRKPPCVKPYAQIYPDASVNGKSKPISNAKKGKEQVR